MKATIQTTNTESNEVVHVINYDEEIQAQYAFDEYTKCGNEWKGLFQWDLIAHSPLVGPCCRRTMYTN